MNTRPAAGMALLACLSGTPIRYAQFRSGGSRLWLGGKIEVTRAVDPLLFRVTTVGFAAFLAGLIVLCVALPVFGA